MRDCPQTGLFFLKTSTCLGLKGCLRTGDSHRSHAPWISAQLLLPLPISLSIKNVPISISRSGLDLPSRQMVLRSPSHSDQGSRVLTDWPAPLLTEPGPVPTQWHRVWRGECHQGMHPTVPFPDTQRGIWCVCPSRLSLFPWP